jgi:hypothetical protein
MFCEIWSFCIQHYSLCMVFDKVHLQNHEYILSCMSTVSVTFHWLNLLNNPLLHALIVCIWMIMFTFDYLTKCYFIREKHSRVQTTKSYGCHSYSGDALLWWLSKIRMNREKIIEFTPEAANDQQSLHFVTCGLQSH